MGLTQWFERVAGAVSGATARLVKDRKILFFDPVYFDVDDVPDVTVQGTTSDPGIGTGYTRVRPRAGSIGRAASLTTEDDTPAVILSVPFADNAIATGGITVLALAVGVGAYQKVTLGGLLSTVNGVLGSGGTPTENEFWSADPDPGPSYNVVYNTSTDALDFTVTGLSGETVKWSVCVDLLVITA